jgi:hypothetical protein
VLRPGDVVVAMGTVDALKEIEPLFVPSRTSPSGTVLGDLG